MEDELTKPLTKTEKLVVEMFMWGPGPFIAGPNMMSSIKRHPDYKSIETIPSEECDHVVDITGCTKGNTGWDTSERNPLDDLQEGIRMFRQCPR